MKVAGIRCQKCFQGVFVPQAYRFGARTIYFHMPVYWHVASLYGIYGQGSTPPFITLLLERAFQSITYAIPWLHFGSGMLFALEV